MSQLYIRKAHIHKRLQTLCDPLGSRVILAGEERNSFLDTHIEDIINIQSLVSDLKDFRLEPLSSAGFTYHRDIRHELHADLDKTLTLTLRATSSVHIERKM